MLFFWVVDVWTSISQNFESDVTRPGRVPVDGYALMGSAPGPRMLTAGRGTSAWKLRIQITSLIRGAWILGTRRKGKSQTRARRAIQGRILTPKTVRTCPVPIVVTAFAKPDMAKVAGPVQGTADADPMMCALTTDAAHPGHVRT